MGLTLDLADDHLRADGCAHEVGGAYSAVAHARGDCNSGGIPIFIALVPGVEGVFGVDGIGTDVGDLDAY